MYLVLVLYFWLQAFTGIFEGTNVLGYVERLINKARDKIKKSNNKYAEM